MITHDTITISALLIAQSIEVSLVYDIASEALETERTRSQEYKTRKEVTRYILSQTRICKLLRLLSLLRIDALSVGLDLNSYLRHQSIN